MNNQVNPAISSQVRKDIVLREAEVLVDPDFTNGEASLSAEEIAFFKENGFLIKRGLLDEPEAFKSAVDLVWDSIPRGIMKRDDPQTWYDSPHEHWTEEDVENVGQLAPTGGWRMRSREVIGKEPFLLDKIANHPRMREVVTAFIGEPVKYVKRVRGVYCVFPKPPGTPGKLSPHADGTAAHVQAMAFVEEVRPKGGGFTIWPGSHLLLHPYYTTVFSSIVNPDLVDEFSQARDEALENITPIECPGNAGDVVFWHPRLIHSSGINLSSDFGEPAVRFIVPCDFQRDGLTYFDVLDRGPGPNHQWWVDTRNFREDVPPTEDNVWDAWAI